MGRHATIAFHAVYGKCELWACDHGVYGRDVAALARPFSLQAAGSKGVNGTEGYKYVMPAERLTVAPWRTALPN